MSMKQLDVFDPKQVESIVQEHWSKNKIVEEIVDFKKNLKQRGKKFYLLDGPPYVNGVPHIGHVKTIVFKDAWAKFKFMQGFATWFQPGFDCGGLPIENKVEEQLGVKSKRDIEEKIGVEKFIQACKDFAEANKPRWMNLYKILGAWKGWIEPYMTHKNYYKESGWWTIKQMFEKGLLVEGHKPGFWCPHCETVLSGYEVTDSYKDVQDPSIYIKFPLRNRPGEYILAWTTTPWTLPANVAIVVHPDETYVKVEFGDKKEKLILAKARLDNVMKECGIENYKVLEKFPGKELEGLRYEPILDIPAQKELKKNENAHQVLLSIPIMKKRVVSKAHVKGDVGAEEEFGHMVTMDSGSGCVHTAPGHGDVDNKLGKHYNLPEPSPVNDQGCLTEEAGEFAGLFVKRADKAIMNKLKESGYLLKAGTIVHSYPLCWRCKSPLIYRMCKQWFVTLDVLRNKILKENKRVNWLPEFAGQRFENLVADAPDWAVTRQRYWGIPLPIWVCEKCDTKKVIGSVEELKKHATKELPKQLNLDKDVIDKIKLRCECGGDMIKDPDIMDVWFDSGISPWASIGYPFKNKELFKKLWKVDMVDESQDQIRGWFYTLMLSSVATFGERPYEAVSLNGWTLDEKGEKMSKSLGNVIYADYSYEQLGADLLRFFFFYDVAPWETQKVDINETKKLMRFFNILWNSYKFAKLYASRITKKPSKVLFKTEDEWILSKLNSLIESTTKDFEEFKFHYVGRNIMKFVVDDFSRTYIKLIRDRVSPNYTGKDRIGAEYCVYEVLNKVCILLAPISPFISEYIYLDLFKGKKKSVHLESWLEPDKKVINKKLETQFELASEILTNMNALRQERGLKLRWPLKQVVVEMDDTKGVALKDVEDIIKKLGNVKDVKLAKVPKTLALKELLVDDIKVRIGLDTAMTEELKQEALLREVLREVQNQRKQSGLTYKDKITLFLSDKTLKRFKDEIKKNVGAKDIKFNETKGKGLEIMGKKVIIRIEKV